MLAKRQENKNLFRKHKFFQIKQIPLLEHPCKAALGSAFCDKENSVPSGYALDYGRDALSVSIHRAGSDLPPILGIIQQDMKAGFAAASPDGCKKLHGAVRIVFPKIKIFVSHHALVLDICNHAGKDVNFRNHTAAGEIAGNVGGSDFVGIEGILEAQGGHFHCGDAPVFQDFHLFYAATPGHQGAVRHAVIKNIPLPLDLAEGAMVVSGGKGLGIIHDVPPVGKRSRGAVGGGVGQPAAQVWRVDKVIGVSNLSGGASFKKSCRFFRGECGQNVFLESIV